MEFPELGQHCSEKTCSRLDFLPMKCDACDQIFCKDHIQYGKHSCERSYQKDVQVPVCPLCNMPVPVKRGELPDIKVGEHIDGNCKFDPSINTEKIYTNKCSAKGCKTKELVPVTCEKCRKNYCLKHRHPQDHKCQGFQGKVLSPAGTAALARAQQPNYVKLPPNNPPPNTRAMQTSNRNLSQGSRFTTGSSRASSQMRDKSCSIS